MQVTIDVDLVNVESTRAPYWLVVDTGDSDDPIRLGNIFSRIKGVFFSRLEAEEYLEFNKEDHSSRARVLCFSGVGSGQYDRATGLERGRYLLNNGHRTNVGAPV